MNFLEAVRLMKQGKKIRRKTWADKSAWHIEGDNLFSNEGQIINDWESAEDKKTLSDKFYFGDELLDTGDSFYKEEDIKEAVNKFIDYLRSPEYYHSESEVLKKAREIFGDNLLDYIG